MAQTTMRSKKNVDRSSIVRSAPHPASTGVNRI
jgi:hypothetical protein